MITRDSVFKIGRVGRAHGIKGEVSIHITDDVFDRVEAEYLLIEVEGLLVPFFIEEYRFKSDTTVLMKLEGIDEADRATALTGCDVYFPRQLADDDEGHLSWSQLVGFRIVDAETHHDVGTVTAVDLTTANTLFEVQTDDGKEILIPAADELTDIVDPDSRTIHIRLPEGLLEL